MALTVKNLSIAISGKTLIKNIDLEFKPGEVWGILGCNGSGKTSLLHTLAGLKNAAHGSVYLNAQSLSDIPTRQRACEIGLLFQHYDDIFPASVLETVLIGRHPHCQSWRWETAEDIHIAEQALEVMGLKALSQNDITCLSGGERRRVALATLLAQQPAYHLLDEPTNHLDIKQQITILKLFQRLAHEQHKCVIMTLHDINQASAFCDRIILIVNAEKVLVGACGELLNAENLNAVYGQTIKKYSIDGKTFYIADISTANHRESLSSAKAEDPVID